MKDKTKNIVIAVLALLLIISFIIIFFMISNKNNSIKEINGKIIVADREYAIIETEDEDYLVTGIHNNYEIGDEVKFTFKAKNLDANKNPKTIEIEDEKILKKYIKEDTLIGEDKEEPTETQPPVSTQKPSNNNTVKPSKEADKEVMTYLNDLDKEFKSGNITDHLKSGFITVVDFLFYDGSIKGHTLKEISDSVKLKVLSMALYFDKKIDTYFPGYKESISSTTGKIYTNVKNTIVETYLNVASTVCKENSDVCDTAKDGFKELKKNFGLTWSLIKDIAGDGVSKLKNWYEIFREQ